jgi:hypothetical protein
MMFIIFWPDKVVMSQEHQWCGMSKGVHNNLEFHLWIFKVSRSNATCIESNMEDSDDKDLHVICGDWCGYQVLDINHFHGSCFGHIHITSRENIRALLLAPDLLRRLLRCTRLLFLVACQNRARDQYGHTSSPPRHGAHGYYVGPTLWVGLQIVAA